MFINDAFAQAAGAASSSSISGTLVQLGLIFLIFYLLLIRPQQKKMKQHEAMLKAIKKGDKVITGGGIFGKVVSASDLELEVEIAHNVTIKVLRAAVRDLVTDAAVQGKVEPTKIETRAATPKKAPANSNKK